MTGPADGAEGGAGDGAGEGIEIEGGGCRVSVDPVGAALRQVRVDGYDLVPTFENVTLARRLYAGVVCAPWPNRVRGARYRWRGGEYRLVPTPAEPGHALHGLVSDIRWRVAEHGDASVRLVTDVAAAPGWPFAAELSIRYEATGGGVTASLTARNAGDVVLPYGCCPHPYLSPPTPRGGDAGPVDGWQVELPARSVLVPDGANVASGPPEPVAGTARDLTRPRAFGDLVLDDCFTDLDRDEGGTARARLFLPGADVATELTWGPWAPWLQVFSGDEPSVYRRVMAVEPMSCPPDAYNSGTGLVELAPGETHEAGWRIALVD